MSKERSPEEMAKLRERGRYYRAARKAREPFRGRYLAMVQRCENIRAKSFHNYGARGIFVCYEWRTDRFAFYKWCEENGVCVGLQIDRRNNDGPYCPENCRVVTARENCRNGRFNRPIGGFSSRAEAIDVYGFHKETVAARLRRGWSEAKALETPVAKPLPAARGWRRSGTVNDPRQLTFGFPELTMPAESALLQAGRKRKHVSARHNAAPINGETECPQLRLSLNLPAERLQ